MRLVLGTVTVPGFRIEEVLGRGGMGVVYRAHQRSLDRDVALKVLSADLSDDPEFAARFRREGRLQASLEHPHVVTVYEAGEAEDGLYLAMQLVPGSTLAELLHAGGLTAAGALRLLRQVAGALDAAHAAGLVHRDVKPQNVLVDENHDAYLGDFGLTRVGDTEALTATGRLLGTVAYLAPEVIRGGAATPASDRYAFAAIAFECLAGSRVFPWRSAAATMFAHVSEPPPPISGRRPELPAALDPVFDRALAKDPARRPATAVALVDAVTRALERGGGAELGPPPSHPPTGDTDTATIEPPAAASPPIVAAARPWRRLLAFAAVALAAAGVATAVTLALDDPDTSAEPAADPAPAPLRGATVLGSDLAEPGRALDCRGEAPGPRSPSCTIAQDALPQRTVVVPENGVVRRWAVRSARGELALVVLRSREGGQFQVARSRNEFVEDGRVHAFPTDVAVEQGDRLGVVATAGSAAGTRPGVDGATTLHWTPRLSGTVEPPDRGGGAEGELLLRAEVVPGARQRMPDRVAGAAAASLPRGRVLAKRTTRFPNGEVYEHRLVAVGGRVAADQLRDGRRLARIEVPDFRPADGRVLIFELTPNDPGVNDFGLYIEYVNADSARVLSHYYAVLPGGFQQVN